MPDRDQRRKRKQLERPLVKPVPLLMQPFSILAGAVRNDMIDQGRNQMIDIHRESEGAGAVGELESNAHESEEIC